MKKKKRENSKLRVRLAPRHEIAVHSDKFGQNFEFPCGGTAKCFFAFNENSKLYLIGHL